jgi:hypothetical protein
MDEFLDFREWSRHEVGLYKLTHRLKGAWFQPLNLSSEKPVSKFAAFTNSNLHRYHEGDKVGEEGAAWDTAAERAAWLAEMRAARSFAAAAYCVYAFLSQL